jgi:glycosyltransferase 2 family protein
MIDQKRIPTWLGSLAKIGVSAIMISLVVWQVGPTAVVPEKIRWWYVVYAVILFLLSNVLGSFQWNLLLRSAAIELPTMKVLRAYFVALFFNNFFIGGVGGDVLRAIDVSRNANNGRAGHTESGVATIVMDRFLGLFTMLWFAGIGVELAHDSRKATLFIFGLLALFVVAGILLTSRRIGTRADRLITKLLPNRLAIVVVNLRAGFASMRERPGTLILAACMSWAVQGMRILVHYLCAVGVGAISIDDPAGLAAFFTYIPIVSIVAAIPISIGGLGPRETAAVMLFHRAGIVGGGVVTMELLAHLVTLVSSLPGAIAFIIGGAPNGNNTAVHTSTGDGNELPPSGTGEKA